MRYLYAAIWFAVFSYVGWLVYSADILAADKGKIEIVTLIALFLGNYLGKIGSALVFVGIGIAAAAWCIWGKEEGEEKAQ
jgi:hypothetical protein